MNEIAYVNDRWRVMDDGIQWILEVRCGRKTAKRSGYTGRRFHRQRTPLIRSIDELCGEVDRDALALVRELPDRYDLPRFRIVSNCRVQAE